MAPWWSISRPARTLDAGPDDVVRADGIPDDSRFGGLWGRHDEVAGNGVDDDRRSGDFVGRDNDPTDEEGHGTHVAGTIGARGNNDAVGPDPGLPRRSEVLT